ncbi:RPM1-interacting protein 4 [Amborella trichopoda]|uniref:RPM1-interacting protein 4 n=1 Tax=Amborella trichopoda TaxID=13333 RepID=UPI0005D366C9|nr:RPM1-interacting protein 4 [Amborella trichopoda]|eukprot:XP_011626172.1 RPM1-interacting protein 4 [Amborella trichopoda]
MSQDKGVPLPKFGEWDVNNPASAEGFTVIFNKARDEKKTGGNSGTSESPRKSETSFKQEASYPSKSGKKWFCCVL